MNRILKSGWLGLLCFSFPWAALASWTTPRYDVDLLVQANGTLQVTEKITADFSRESHHGIYRDIPLDMFDVSKGKNRRMRLRLLFVDDGADHFQPYHESRTGGWYHLKIGDPSVTLQEVRPYRIVYEIENWCLSFNEHQELYWNAVGTEWLSSIQGVRATVSLPPAVDLEKMGAEAYIGAQGSRSQEGRIQKEAQGFEILSPRPLKDHEGMTVRISWPGAPIPLVSKWKIWWWALTDHLIFLLPILTLFLMFFLWWKTGRDPEDRGTITVQYHPPEGLTAMTSGTLIDESCDIRDITAGMIELAVRGFLKIEQKDEKILFFNSAQYSFLRVEGKGAESLPGHLKFLYDKIFSYGSKVKLSDLDCSFYKYMPEIKKLIYKDLIAGGYLSRNPETVRAFYYVLGFVGPMVGIFLWAFVKEHLFHSALDGMDVAGLGLTALVIMVFGHFMSARTLKGVQAREQLLGLEEYIKRAEAESLKYDEKKNVFEEILPFAMALGLSSKWSKAFSGAFNEPPSWYYGPAPSGGWSPRAFEHSLTQACSTMGNSMSSSPRSSGSGGGGGFSGGGGGGGGGGAW